MNSNKHSKMTALALALTIILSLFNNFTVFAENGLNDETVTENPVVEDKVEETEPNEGVEELEEPIEDEKPEEVVEEEKPVELTPIKPQEELLPSTRVGNTPNVDYKLGSEIWWNAHWPYNNILPRRSFHDGYFTKYFPEKVEASEAVNIIMYNDITTFNGETMAIDKLYASFIDIRPMPSATNMIVYGRGSESEPWTEVYSGTDSTGHKYFTETDGYLFFKVVYEGVTEAGKGYFEVGFKPTQKLLEEVYAVDQNSNPMDLINYGGMTIQNAETGEYIWAYDGTDYKIPDGVYPKDDGTHQIGGTNSCFNGYDSKQYRVVNDGAQIEVIRKVLNVRVLDWLSVRNLPWNKVTWNNDKAQYDIIHQKYEDQTAELYMPGGYQNLDISQAHYIVYLPENIFISQDIKVGDQIGSWKIKSIEKQVIKLNEKNSQKVTIEIDLGGRVWLGPNENINLPLYTTDFNNYKCGSTFSYPTRLVINGKYYVPSKDGGKEFSFDTLDRDHINNTGHWYRDTLGSGDTPDKSKLVDNSVNDWVYAVNASGTIPCISLTYDPNPVEGQTVSGTTPVDTQKYSYALNDDKGNVIRDKATVLEKGDMVSSGGYQFAGWNTKADGTGIKYLPGAEADIAENTTLYAMWANTVDVVVTKTWIDENNRDGIRPDDVTVQLMKGTVVEGAEVVLNEGNGWSHTWENLLKFDNDGDEFEYTVIEEAVDKYKTNIVYTPTEEGTKTKITAAITNTHDPEKITISGTKTWDDKNDQDGKRPTSIEVKLLADGTELATKSVTKADDWNYEFKDVYKYKENEVGVEIKYTTEEVVPTGYAFEYTDDKKINITNKYSPEETSRTVVKTWTDENDKDKLRPASVKVQLYKDGVALGTPAVVKSSEKWSYTWTGLDKYRDGGIEVVYTIKEVDVPNGYTPRYSEDKATNSFKVNNLHEPKNEVDYSPIIWDWGHTTPTIDGTKLHRAYINGYPDGSVKPQGEITRGEVAAIMSRLHADVEEIEYSTETKYADVKATDWYAKHIAYVSDKGLMEGYEDGSFKPENKITRAEYATVVARFKNLERIATSFEDSKDHWANEFIGAVANKKWITGYPDGSFKPMNNISREEVATMTNKMLDRNVDEVGVGNLNIKKFTDLLHGSWSYYEMVEASNTHEYVRRGTNSIVEDWKNVK